MTSQPIETATLNADELFAERDLSMLKGGGMESDRPYITWGQLIALRKAGRGQELRKYALIMRMPGGAKNSVPGAGNPVAMPAEKERKWFGQGFRACVSVDDTSLVVFPPPPEPRIWLPSMVEEAMGRGEVIPDEMAPQGYIGPTLSIKAMRAEINAGESAPMSMAQPGQPEIFHCTAENCARFFDSEQGRGLHERTQHKDESPGATA